jgi:hypothetical protein
MIYVYVLVYMVNLPYDHLNRFKIITVEDYRCWRVVYSFVYTSKC